MGVEEAVAIRGEYNRIVAQTLALQSQQQGLQFAVVRLEGEAERYRAKIAALEAQAAAAAAGAPPQPLQAPAAAGGLRQRRKAGVGAGAGGGGGGGGDADDDDEDDNTVRSSRDGGDAADASGCPLYVVMIVGLGTFLLGWLVP